MNLSSGEQTASVADVADRLEDMGLRSGMERRVIGCWSGAGQWYQGNEPDWLTRFNAGTLGDVSDVENSFAAGLHEELQRRGLLGSTGGYVAPLVFGRQPTIDREGELGVHMAGGRGALEWDGRIRRIDMRTSKAPATFYPRRRDLRVQWGGEPSRLAGFFRAARSAMKYLVG